MAMTQTKRVVLSFLLGVVTTLAVVFGIQMLQASSAYSDYKTKLAKPERIELGPLTVNPSWVISGKPVFRVNDYGSSPDRSTVTGIWEATGPAKFVWTYGVDETIYILEGSVEIEYLGKNFILTAGDSTHFAAGTTAIWVVPERVKKKFAVYRVGLVEKIARKTLK